MDFETTSSFIATICAVVGIIFLVYQFGILPKREDEQAKINMLGLYKTNQRLIDNLIKELEEFSTFNQDMLFSGNLTFGFSGGSSSGRLGVQWKLDKTLSAQGRYYYEGPSATAQSRVRAMHWADFGISKTLLAGRLSAVADVTNILDSRRYRTMTTGPDYIFSTMSRFNGARYRLSIVYKFKDNATVREAKTGNRN